MKTYESNLARASYLSSSGYEVRRTDDLPRGVIKWQAFDADKVMVEWSYFMFRSPLVPRFIHHVSPDDFIYALESTKSDFIEPYENRGFVDFTLADQGFSTVHTWDPVQLTDAQLSRLARLATRV